MSDPQTPEPDSKDWTWTVQRPCPECGYDAAAVARADVPDLIRRYVAVLDDRLREEAPAQRPAPTVWSPLEYAAHVRDVCALYAHRLRLMLAQDDPLYPNWDQDETALAHRYWEQDPAFVAAAMRANAEGLALRFAALEPSAWGRTGRRSDGASFSVDTFARYLLHDLAHHAWDVRPQVHRT